MITKLMTKKEYSEHRGCSKAYISKLIKTGKITIEYGDKIDPEKADIVLGPIKNQGLAIESVSRKEENSKSCQQKVQIISLTEALEISASQIISAENLYEAQKYKEVYTALTKKAEYEKIIGSLTMRDEIKKELFETDRIIRDKIQNIPQRICPSLPCSDEVRFMVEQHLKIEIQSILESISHAVSS